MTNVLFGTNTFKINVKPNTRCNHLEIIKWNDTYKDGVIVTIILLLVHIVPASVIKYIEDIQIFC